MSNKPINFIQFVHPASGGKVTEISGDLKAILENEESMSNDFSREVLSKNADKSIEQMEVFLLFKAIGESENEEEINNFFDFLFTPEEKQAYLKNPTDAVKGYITKFADTEKFFSAASMYAPSIYESYIDGVDSQNAFEDMDPKMVERLKSSLSKQELQSLTWKTNVAKAMTEEKEGPGAFKKFIAKQGELLSKFVSNPNAKVALGALTVVAASGPIGAVAGPIALSSALIGHPKINGWVKKTNEKILNWFESKGINTDKIRDFEASATKRIKKADKKAQSMRRTLAYGGAAAAIGSIAYGLASADIHAVIDGVSKSIEGDYLANVEPNSSPEALSGVLDGFTKPELEVGGDVQNVAGAATEAQVNEVSGVEDDVSKPLNTRMYEFSIALADQLEGVSTDDPRYYEKLSEIAQQYDLPKAYIEEMNLRAGELSIDEMVAQNSEEWGDGMLPDYNAPYEYIDNDSQDIGLAANDYADDIDNDVNQGISIEDAAVVVIEEVIPNASMVTVVENLVAMDYEVTAENGARGVWGIAESILESTGGDTSVESIDKLKDQIIELNNMGENPDLIRPGDTLKIEMPLTNEVQNAASEYSKDPSIADHPKSSAEKTADRLKDMMEKLDKSNLNGDSPTGYDMA